MRIGSGAEELKIFTAKSHRLASDPDLRGQRSADALQPAKLAPIKHRLVDSNNEINKSKKTLSSSGTHGAIQP
jgi:hypothetical protein